MSRLSTQEMTVRTTKVHQTIQEFVDAYGYAPGLRDIAVLADLSSTSVVKYHVRRLVASGAIQQIPRIARGIVLLKRLEER